MRTICETLADHAGRTQDPSQLTAAVRVALGRSIVQNIIGLESELPVITLDPNLEQVLLQTVQAAGDGAAGLEPGMADQLHMSIINAAQKQEMSGQPVVLLVAPALRSLLSKFARRAVPSMHVLSFSEIPDNRQIKVVNTVGSQQPSMHGAPA
jgi:flagellar biosynthesis protein FlhA